LAAKGDKRQRTREALIEAAREVVRVKGFHAVSLQEVAEQAGMSRGAIYGNFRNREELLFAVVATLWPPVAPQPLSPGASLRELLGSIGRAVAQAARERRAMAVGAASFQLYALSHPAMRQVIAEENAKIYTQIAERITALIPSDSLPMPAETFVRVTHALSDGLMFAHFMSPEEFTDDVIVTAFEALAGPGPQGGQRSRQAEPREHAGVETDEGADLVTSEGENEKAGEVPDAVR
jgi:AcrR family transcriptional regulator